MAYRTNQVFDVIIAGGGIAGFALACCLKDALGAGVKVLVVEPRLGESQGRERASAISVSRRAFSSSKWRLDHLRLFAARARVV